jgi:hypothetical protein
MGYRVGKRLQLLLRDFEALGLLLQLTGAGGDQLLELLLAADQLPRADLDRHEDDQLLPTSFLIRTGSPPFGPCYP